MAGARFAMRAGMLAPEEPGEPLTSVSIEALARWRAMRASIDLAICRAVALGVDPVIGAHATLGWSGAPIEPLLDMHVDWATAAAQPSVRVGPALAALPGNAQSLVAIASYGTAAGELRFDLIYAMDLQVGD